MSTIRGSSKSLSMGSFLHGRGATAGQAYAAGGGRGAMNTMGMQKDAIAAARAHVDSKRRLPVIGATEGATRRPARRFGVPVVKEEEEETEEPTTVELRTVWGRSGSLQGSEDGGGPGPSVPAYSLARQDITQRRLSMRRLHSDGTGAASQDGGDRPEPGGGGAATTGEGGRDRGTAPASGPRDPRARRRSMVTSVVNMLKTPRASGTGPTERRGTDAEIRRQIQVAEKEAEQNALYTGHEVRGRCRRVRRWTLLHPNRRFRISWDLAVVVVLAYVAIATPFRIAFAEEGLHRAFSVMGTLVTVFFLVDMVLNFRTGYMAVDTGSLVMDERKIALRYLRGWFLLDFLSSFPWELLVEITQGDTESVSPQLFKTLRLLRLSRLTKLLRLLKVSQLTNFLEDRLELNRNHLYIARLLGMVAIIAHFSACGFYFIATLDSEWPRRSWVVADSRFDSPVASRYLSALYWAFTVMTTVGFGDIHAVSDTEKVYSIVAMLVAAATFGGVIANMSEIMTEMNVHKSIFNQKINELNAYMNTRRFPKELRVRMRRYFRFYLERKTVFDERAVFEELTPHLRALVSDHFANSTIANIPFFQQRDPYFIGQIIPALKPIAFVKGDTITSMGDIAQELYIITSGQAQVYVPYRLLGLAGLGHPREGKTVLSRVGTMLANAGLGRKTPRSPLVRGASTPTLSRRATPKSGSRTPTMKGPPTRASSRTSASTAKKPSFLSLGERRSEKDDKPAPAYQRIAPTSSTDTNDQPPATVPASAAGKTPGKRASLQPLPPRPTGSGARQNILPASASPLRQRNDGFPRRLQSGVSAASMTTAEWKRQEREATIRLEAIRRGEFEALAGAAATSTEFRSTDLGKAGADDEPEAEAGRTGATDLREAVAGLGEPSGLAPFESSSGSAGGMHSGDAKEGERGDAERELVLNSCHGTEDGSSTGPFERREEEEEAAERASLGPGRRVLPSSPRTDSAGSRDAPETEDGKPPSGSGSGGVSASASGVRTLRSWGGADAARPSATAAPTATPSAAVSGAAAPAPSAGAGGQRSSADAGDDLSPGAPEEGQAGSERRTAGSGIGIGSAGTEMEWLYEDVEACDREEHVAYAQRGCMLGEMALVVPTQQSRRCASIRVVSPALDVYAVDYVEIRGLLLDFRDALETLMSTAYKRQRRMAAVREAIAVRRATLEAMENTAGKTYDSDDPEEEDDSSDDT